MPLKKCTQNGKSGWKWGDSGKCYTGPGGKKKAIKQGVAIEGPDKFASKASDEEFDIAVVLNELNGLEKADLMLAKKMSRKSINDLPDSDFAYIEPGGKKDASGKTVPRRLRHFPIHDAAHVENALSRIGQGAKFGKEALPKVKRAAKKFGIKVSE